MEIETHFETRNEYIKIGNELASLEEKQKRDKEETEKAKKEFENKMSSMISSGNVNTLASKSGDNPMYVPMKHNSNEPAIANSKLDASGFKHNKGISSEKINGLAKPLKKADITIPRNINSNMANNINKGNYFKNNNI